MKIVFSGLENAGKTSIIYTLDRKTAPIEMNPTLGADISVMRTLGLDIARWDLGGQSTYRKKYMREFERHFSDTSILFYIISVPDANNHERALKFLKKIVENLSKEKESTHFGIFLHKYDPELRNFQEITSTVEMLKKKLEKILDSFLHAIWETSIFQPETISQAFAQTLVETFPNGELIRKQLEELADKLGSDMTLIHAVGKEDRNPLLYGRYIKSRSQITRAAQFLQTTHNFAIKPDPDLHANPVIIPFSEIYDIVSGFFFVGEETLMLSILLPRGNYNAKPAVQNVFYKTVKEFEELLSEITTAVKTVTV